MTDLKTTWCAIIMVAGLLVGAIAPLSLAQPAAAAQLGEDGLHVAPWMALTFKDLAEDLETARDEGKRLAVIVEQAGCIYCKKLHDEVFSQADVRQYITENFMVVRLNMYGDEEVIDLDGTVLTEKTAVRRWGIVFTPTVLFLPEHATDEPAGKSAVARMPGAFGAPTVRNMFQWVRDKVYEQDIPFQRYHAEKLRETGASSE